MSLWFMLEITLTALVAATATGQALRLVVRSEPAGATLANANLRIAAWWVLCGVAGAAMILGSGTVVALFAVFSCLALREFTRVCGGRTRADTPVFWSLLAITIVQYWLVWSHRYSMFSMLIPLCALFSIPVRAAKICLGLTVCTYCLSHAPALLMLDIPGYAGRNITLLFYFLLVVQSSDVLQYLWGKLLGRRPVAPGVSPHKTWEGLLGGGVTATAMGTALYRATPFGPWQAAAICLAVTLMGFAGGLAMSAVKRARGVKDFGTLVAGHGGVLDRVDSICFSAPVFFHLVRYFYAA